MTYGRWAGRVYDGPLEGEHRSEVRPFFEFNWSPAVPLGVHGSGETSEWVNCYRFAYRWSNPLRAWVFDWRTAPQPKAKPTKRDLVRRYSKPSRGNEWMT